MLSDDYDAYIIQTSFKTKLGDVDEDYVVKVFTLMGSDSVKDKEERRKHRNRAKGM